MIGKKHVIPAITQTDNSNFYAIASRHIDTVNYSSSVKRCSSYEELLDDPLVEAVYVPLPNALHCKWAIEAMKRKKHVLCEKPIAMNEDEIRRMTDAAKRNGVLLMEALMYRFTAKTQILKKLLLENRIGLIRHMRVHFGYKKGFVNDARDKRELGGGSLYDVGCYCVDFMNWVMKTQNSKLVDCFTFHNMDDCEVDQGTSAVLKYSNGAVASLDCWFNAGSNQGIMLLGENGCIYADESFRGTPEPIGLRTGQDKEMIPVPSSQAYELEIKSFAHAVLTGDTSALVPLEDSIENMRVMDTLFRSTVRN